MNLKRIKKEREKVHESFDDVVFHDRNKDYGAYYLRRTYHRALIPGILITIVLPLVLFLYQLYLEFKYETNESKDAVIYYDPSMMQNLDELAYMQLLEPPKKSDRPDTKTEEAKNLVPEVVDSVTRHEIEKEVKNSKDSLGLESDSSSTGPGFPGGVDDGSLAIYSQVDSLPQFPGGNVAMIRFIVNNIKYPEQAVKDNIAGIVFVKFCIKNDGTINKVEVQKGIDPLLDAEAVRVVKAMPKWKPGKIRNKNVSVMFSLPINFNLRNRSR
jgi:periplasmic protein TonB